MSLSIRVGSIPFLTLLLVLTLLISSPILPSSALTLTALLASKPISHFLKSSGGGGFATLDFSGYGLTDIGNGLNDIALSNAAIMFPIGIMDFSRNNLTSFPRLGSTVGPVQAYCNWCENIDIPLFRIDLQDNLLNNSWIGTCAPNPGSPGPPSILPTTCTNANQIFMTNAVASKITYLDLVRRGEESGSRKETKGSCFQQYLLYRCICAHCFLYLVCCLLHCMCICHVFTES